MYDAEGRLAAEYTINIPPPANPTISYLTEDALGSVRVTTNSFGEIKARRDFLPFGEELYAGLAGRTTSQKYSSSADDTRKKFATYQRDTETGLDFAQSRYYSPMHGRFTSPDEFKGGPDELFDFEEDAADNPTFYGDLENPQSLNKYQYGYNNPYKYNDPSGHCPPCAVVAEVALTFWDVVETVKTFRDPKASTAEKVAAVVGTAAGVVLPGGGYGVAGKAVVKAVKREGAEVVAKKADDVVKPATKNVTPQKAENLRKAEQKGIPKNQLGPSGKPKVHVVKHPTTKRAKDASRNEGGRKPARDNNPKKGKSHYHPVDRDGNRRKGKNNVHHEFPLKRGKLPEQ